MKRWVGRWVETFSGAPPPLSTHLSRTLSILGGNGGQESDKKAFYISNRVYWCEWEQRNLFSTSLRELLRISFDLPSDWFSVPNEQMHWTARPSREPSSYATLPSNWFVQFLTSLSLFFQPSATRAAAASHGTRRDLCWGTRAKRAWFNHGQIQIYEMDMSHVGTCQSTHSWNLLWRPKKG